MSFMWLVRIVVIREVKYTSKTRIGNDSYQLVVDVSSRFSFSPKRNYLHSYRVATATAESTDSTTEDANFALAPPPVFGSTEGGGAANSS